MKADRLYAPPGLGAYKQPDKTESNCPWPRCKNIGTTLVDDMNGSKRLYCDRHADAIMHNRLMLQDGQFTPKIRN